MSKHKADDKMKTNKIPKVFLNADIPFAEE